MVTRVTSLLLKETKQLHVGKAHAKEKRKHNESKKPYNILFSQRKKRWNNKAQACVHIHKDCTVKK